ncbi:MAG: zinc finger MYND domain-containing protein [Gammaproteobacteria bacterium]|nr:zinc finger MYND domain-containing protein [Gammaproteobacteria bacterium]
MSSAAGTCISVTGEAEEVVIIVVVHQRLLDVENMCPLIDLSYWRLTKATAHHYSREWLPFAKTLKLHVRCGSLDEEELKLWDEILPYFEKKTIQPESVEKMWPGISSRIKKMKLVRCFRRVALHCIYCDTSPNQKLFGMDAEVARSSLQKLISPVEKLSIDEELCSQCHKASPNLKRCGGCLVAQYCSAECQKLGWRAHKSRCKKGAQKNRNEEKSKGEHCNFCEVAKGELQTCSGCGRAKYCDKKCQGSHWAVHKYVCLPYRALENILS